MAERKASTAVAAPASPGNAVAVAAPVGLPMEISRGTVRIPSIKVGEQMSPAVGDGLVKFGDIYTTTGTDDSSPKVIAEAKAASTAHAPVRLHVLSVTEGRSDSVDNELVTYTLQGGRWISPYDGTEAGPNAYVTQTYLVCLPEVDPSTPFKLLLKKTSLGAARNINTALADHLSRGGTQFDLAFELTAAKREKGTYRWNPFAAKQTEARDEDVAAAIALGNIVASFQAAPAQANVTPTDTPDI